MHLIVNADDCGYSPGINRGIMHTLRKGIVTSTTLMVNQPYSRHAVGLLKRWGLLSVGLHLNLTRGRPISRPKFVSTLVNEAGLFHPPKSIYYLPINVKEVEKEIEAQLGTIFKQELVPTHLDAHHHLQCHPLIRDAMIRVAEKYALPIRHCCSNSKDAFLQAGIPTPDYFISSFQDDRATVPYICNMLRHLSARCTGKSVVEVMTHPGFPRKNVCGSSYHRQRRQEMLALCSPVVKKLVKTLNIELADYRCLSS